MTSDIISKISQLLDILLVPDASWSTAHYTSTQCKLKHYTGWCNLPCSMALIRHNFCA